MPKQCRLCGSTDTEVIIAANPRIKTEIEEGDFSATGSDFGIFYDLAKCNSCKAVFALTDKKGEDFSRLYSESKDKLYLSGALERGRTFEKIIFHLKEFSCGKRRLLDVGSSYGLFLKLASKDWKESFGIELNKEACKYASQILGLNVFCGEISEADFAEGYFDVITAIEVIEHVYDPKVFIRDINKLMRQKGIIYLVCPDITSFSAKLLGSHWWSYRKMHLNYFSKKTIREFLEKNGFSVICAMPYKKTFKVEYILDNLYKLGKFRPFFYLLRSLTSVLRLQELTVTLSFGDIAVTARKK